MDGGEDVGGDELMEEAVALAVASEDAACFPVGDFVKKFFAWDSDFAYEQLVEVVGGYTFFLLRVPFAGFSSGAPGGIW